MSACAGSAVAAQRIDIPRGQQNYQNRWWTDFFKKPSERMHEQRCGGEKVSRGFDEGH
jgi:hypothetical protein